MTIQIQQGPSPHPLAAGLRMVCFDIDGTIVDSRHEVSERSTEVFRFLKDRNIQIGIASGRPLFGVRKLLETYAFDGPCSLFAGALLLDPTSEAVLYECPLTPEQAGIISALCTEHGLYYELYTKDAFFVDLPDHPYTDIHEEYVSARPQRLAQMAEVFDETLYKGLVVIPRADQSEVTRVLCESLPGCSVACSPGAAHREIMFVNITSAHKSRRDTFAAITKHMGIEAKNVLAFGDGETDIQFLSAAGIGIAMGKAPPQVVQAANFVTRSVDEDGVAVAIEHLFGAL